MSREARDLFELAKQLPTSPDREEMLYAASLRMSILHSGRYFGRIAARAT